MILISLLLCGGVYWLFFVDRTDYTKPWFRGTQTVEVCEVDVDSENDCYWLKAYSNGDKITTIYFQKGGYLSASSTSCHKAASIYSYKRFCRFWDQDGDRYDINPNYGEWREYLAK